MEKIVEHATVLDTDQQRVGEVYARALLALGRKSGQLDQLLEQLRAFSDAIARSAAFQHTMESPRISFEQKSKLIDKVLGGRASTEFTNFVKVLTRKQRFECLRAVQAAAQKLYDEYSGRVAATLTTAEPISDDNRRYAAERLAKTLGKEINLTCRVDPAIIAGVVVRVGDTVYDGSTRTQLQRARNVAVQRAYHEIRDSLSRFTSES